MEKGKKREKGFSRRNFLEGAGIFMAGGVLGVGTSLASSPAPTAGTAPALPWRWGKIDPMEAGSRAYRYYHDIGG